MCICIPYDKVSVAYTGVIYRDISFIQISFVQATVIETLLILIRHAGYSHHSHLLLHELHAQSKGL